MAADLSPLLIVLAGCFVGALLVYVFAQFWFTVILNLHLLVCAAALAWRVVSIIHELTAVKFNSCIDRWLATGVAVFLAPSEMLRELCSQAFRSITRHSGMAVQTNSGSPVLVALFAGGTFYVWPSLMACMAMFCTALTVAAVVDLYEPSADSSLLERFSDEPVTAGQTVTFKVKLYRGVGVRYPAGGSLHRVSIEVKHKLESVACEQHVACEGSANEVIVTFVPYKIGDYEVSTLFDGIHLQGSPAVLSVIAGAADPGQSGFVRSRLTHVLCTGSDIRVPMVFLDMYGNQCALEAGTACLEHFYVRLYDEATGADNSSFVEDSVLAAPPDGRDGSVLLCLKCTLPGLHQLCLISRSSADVVDAVRAPSTLLNNSVRILVLREDDWRRVSEITAKPVNSGLYFKASLVRVSTDGDPACDSGSKQSRHDVYCYPSSRQVVIKKYFLNFIPKLMFTFRNSTSLRVTLPSARSLHLADSTSAVLLELDDPCVLAGCIFRWLSNVSGGARVFEEKRDRLHEALAGSHKLNNCPSIVSISVDRSRLVESSYAATKALSASRWTGVFQIHFVGEEGIDRGGLRREWMDLLLAALFDPKQSGLFAAVGNGRAITPDHRCGLATAYYKFAGQIVGKCIVDSARGGGHVQPIRLYFARSFLSQILGLHVDHLAFADDDPELFEQKIKYILNCDDVADLQLTFTDEELDERGNGGRSRTVEIAPKGESRPVTCANRLAYVDALARYRFCTRVRERVLAFKEGFHSLVPEDALIAFDESDLALLLAGGVQSYSAADMRPQVVTACNGEAEHRALERFWAVASGFTDEQMTRLVRFVTGSSLLPPGGFADLQPKISITFSSDVGLLPVSHTCYNNLCLPAYASVERMSECLQLAINEGNLGFGLR